MKKLNSAVIVDTCTKRLTSLKAHVSNKAEISINGKAYKAAAVIAIYQDCSTSARRFPTSARTSRQPSSKARTQSNCVAPPTGAQALGSQHVRRQQSGGARLWLPSAEGAHPHRGEQGASGQACPGDREARHTMGKNQKSKVKGSIVDHSVPAAPAPHTVQVSAPAIISIDAPRPRAGTRRHLGSDQRRTRVAGTGVERSAQWIAQRIGDARVAAMRLRSENKVHRPGLDREPLGGHRRAEWNTAGSTPRRPPRSAPDRRKEGVHDYARTAIPSPTRLVRTFARIFGVAIADDA